MTIRIKGTPRDGDVEIYVDTDGRIGVSLPHYGCVTYVKLEDLIRGLLELAGPWLSQSLTVPEQGALGTALAVHNLRTALEAAETELNQFREVLPLLMADGYSYQANGHPDAPPRASDVAGIVRAIIAERDEVMGCSTCKGRGVVPVIGPCGELSGESCPDCTVEVSNTENDENVQVELGSYEVTHAE